MSPTRRKLKSGNSYFFVTITTLQKNSKVVIPTLFPGNVTRWSDAKRCGAMRSDAERCGAMRSDAPIHLHFLSPLLYSTPSHRCVRCEAQREQIRKCRCMGAHSVCNRYWKEGLRCCEIVPRCIQTLNYCPSEGHLVGLRLAAQGSTTNLRGSKSAI